MVEGEQGHGRLDHLDRAGDHAGAPPETGEPVPLARVVALAALRLVLADVMSPSRQGGVIGRPVVGTKQAHTPALQALEQPIQRGLGAIAAFPVDQPARAALEGLPDPEFLGLFFTKCQTSSISTTAVLAVGSGLGQWRCAWSRTQRSMLCAETPTRLATAFIDSPRQQSSIAWRLSSAGLPRGVVRVNCRPQSALLHRQRCRPQARPDLISTVPRQAGQASGRSAITSPPFTLANACQIRPASLR